MDAKIEFKKIGVIRTPYKDRAPYQPVDKDSGDFRIVLDDAYVDGLADLNLFKYIYIIFFIDRIPDTVSMEVTPSWAPGIKVGLFASRSPNRPNPVGISIVKIKKIVGNEIITSGLDVFDNTPLLDIKPYIKDLDSKEDANYGWLDNVDSNKEHLSLHIKGIPHDY